jgi:hypothetical protein
MELLKSIKSFIAKDSHEGTAKVSMSSSGELSVDVAELVNTQSFRDNIAAVRKIAALAKK